MSIAKSVSDGDIWWARNKDMIQVQIHVGQVKLVGVKDCAVVVVTDTKGVTVSLSMASGGNQGDFCSMLFETFCVVN